jgi:hypothetical protein
LSPSSPSFIFAFCAICGRGKEDHALKLLRKKLQTNFDEDDGKTLLQIFDYIPLAITQAATFINQRIPRVTVSKYLHNLKKSDTERIRLLNKNIIDIRRNNNSSNSIIATWQISFKNICKERPSAARLLFLISLFNRQGIPKSLLEDYYQKSDDSDETVEDFYENVYIFCNYYLIGTNIDDTEFEIHRLVQFSTKIWLESNVVLFAGHSTSDRHRRRVGSGSGSPPFGPPTLGPGSGPPPFGPPKSPLGQGP